MSFPVRSEFQAGPEDRPLDHAPEGFFADVAASFSAMRRLDNFNARETFEDEIWRERLAQVEEASGVRLQHPGSIAARVGRWIEGRGFAGEVERGDAERGEDYAALERRIEELRASNPQYAEAIQPAEVWREEMQRRAAALEERASQSGFAASLTGGVGAAFTDPVNIATAPLGGAGGARTIGGAIAKAAGIEAAINAGLEAANIPVANRWRQELGLDPITREEAAVRIAAGAGFGALLGAGSEGLAQGLGRLSGRSLAEGLNEIAPDDPATRAAAARLEDEAVLAEADPFRDAPDGADLHAQRAADAETVLTRPDAPEAETARARLAAAPAARAEQLDLFTDIPADDYRAAALAPPAELRPGPEPVAARRVQAEALRPAEPGEDLSFTADLFEEDEAIQTGRTVTAAEAEADIEAGFSAVERFRGCVV